MSTHVPQLFLTAVESWSYNQARPERVFYYQLLTSPQITIKLKKVSTTLKPDPGGFLLLDFQHRQSNQSGFLLKNYSRQF